MVNIYSSFIILIIVKVGKSLLNLVFIFRSLWLICILLLLLWHLNNNIFFFFTLFFFLLFLFSYFFLVLIFVKNIFLFNLILADQDFFDIFKEITLN